MRNILLGTTALIAVTALAAPTLASEWTIDVGGYFIGGGAYVDGEFNYFWRDQFTGGHSSTSGISDYNELNFGSDSELHFSAGILLDNGLKVSVFTELELERDGAVNSNADTIDEIYIQIDGGAGRFQFGQNDGVGYQMHIRAPSTFAGHKINNSDPQLDPFAPLGYGNPISTYNSFSDDNIKLSYFTPSFNGVQVGLSFTPNPCKNDTGYASCVYDRFGRNFWEAAATWEIAMDNVEFGFSGAYGQGESGTTGTEPVEWSVGGDATFGGFTVGGSYRDTNTSGISNWDETHMDVGVTYKTGPWGFTLNYADMERTYRTSSYRYNDDANAWIGGVTYTFGPGMQVGAGVQTLDATEVQVDPEDTFSGGQFYSFTMGDGFEGTTFFTEISVAF